MRRQARIADETSEVSGGAGVGAGVSQPVQAGLGIGRAEVSQRAGLSESRNVVGEGTEAALLGVLERSHPGSVGGTPSQMLQIKDPFEASVGYAQLCAATHAGGRHLPY